jgi:hypothetical protein
MSRSDIYLLIDDIDKCRFGWLINDANATWLCDFIYERQSRDRLEMHKWYDKVEAKVFRTIQLVIGGDYTVADPSR